MTIRRFLQDLDFSDLAGATSTVERVAYPGHYNLVISLLCRNQQKLYMMFYEAVAFSLNIEWQISNPKFEEKGGDEFVYRDDSTIIHNRGGGPVFSAEEWQANLKNEYGVAQMNSPEILSRFSKSNVVEGRVYPLNFETIGLGGMTYLPTVNTLVGRISATSPDENVHRLYNSQLCCGYVLFRNVSTINTVGHWCPVRGLSVSSTPSGKTFTSINDEPFGQFEIQCEDGMVVEDYPEVCQLIRQWESTDRA